MLSFNSPKPNRGLDALTLYKNNNIAFLSQVSWGMLEIKLKETKVRLLVILERKNRMEIHLQLEKGIFLIFQHKY